MERNLYPPFHHHILLYSHITSIKCLCNPFQIKKNQHEYPIQNPFEIPKNHPINRYKIPIKSLQTLMHRRQTLHPRRLRRTHGADEGAAQGPWRAQTGRFKAGYMGKPWKSTTNRDTKVNFTKGYKLILTSQNFSLFVSMGISTFTSKEFVIFCRVSKIGNGLNRDLSSTHSRLVVSNIFGIFQNIWDNPSH